MFLALTAYAITWGRKLAKASADLLGWKLTAEQTKAIDGVLTWAMSLAQERWTQFLQKKISEGPANGAEKLALAEQLAREKAPALFANIPSDEFVQLAESKMPSMRPLFAANDPRPGASRPPGMISIMPADGLSLPPINIPKLDPLPGTRSTKVAR